MSSSHRFVLAFCFATVLSAAFGSVVSAQSLSADCDSAGCRPHHGHRVHVPVYTYHGYPRYRRGYSGYPYDPRFGIAAIVRATGQTNLLNAHARTQHARAARLEMENSVQFLQTRLERQRINKESRFGHLHRRGQMVRAQKRAQEMLVSHQESRRPIVDPSTGAVDWPLLLRTSHYDRARQPIDLVFRNRSKFGSINPDHFLPMRDWIERIQAELKANVADYEMEDYVEARDFLRALIDEARQDLRGGQADVQLAAR